MKESKQAAGYNLYANELSVIPAQERQLVSTGITVSIPEGHYSCIASQSGLAAKRLIDVAAGVIDADYKGEVKVLLCNNLNMDFKVTIGNKIA